MNVPDPTNPQPGDLFLADGVRSVIMLIHGEWAVCEVAGYEAPVSCLLADVVDWTPVIPAPPELFYVYHANGVQYAGYRSADDARTGAKGIGGRVARYTNGEWVQ